MSNSTYCIFSDKCSGPSKYSSLIFLNERFLAEAVGGKYRRLNRGKPLAKGEFNNLHNGDRFHVKRAFCYKH